MGEAYHATGNYPEASLNYGMALQLAKQSFDFRNQFRAIDGLVASSSSLGRYSRAFQLLEERLKLASDQESRRQELVTLRSFARLYRQVGDYSKARSFYRQAVRKARALEDGKEEVLLLNEWSQIEFLGGPDRAEH